MHWATKYIGKRWRMGARGPDEFDCWGLCYWISTHELNRPMPCYPVGPRSTTFATKAFERATAGTRWERLAQPREGCIVGLSLRRLLHHVGIYAEADGGMVIHALDKGNVIAQSLASLRASGYQRIEFYWLTSWQR